jgi:hypothetical protein
MGVKEAFKMLSDNISKAKLWKKLIHGNTPTAKGLRVKKQNTKIVVLNNESSYSTIP